VIEVQNIGVAIAVIRNRLDSIEYVIASDDYTAVAETLETIAERAAEAARDAWNIVGEQIAEWEEMEGR
jgi:hypothetical protein